MDIFIEVIDSDQDEKARNRIFKKIKLIFGEIPPHYELLGKISIDVLNEYLNDILKLIRHKTINPDYFGFLRLYIANKYNYTYCISFNSKLLHSRGYKSSIVDNSLTDINSFPFENKLIILAKKTIKAVTDSMNFTEADFKILYDAGWNDKEIFDSIEHAGNMLKNGSILSAYLKKI